MRSARRLASICMVLGALGAVALAQSAFPLMPNLSADPDGTVYWTKRRIPLPALASAEGRKRYVEILNRSLGLKLDAAGKPIVQRGVEGANANSPTQAALTAFP
jgi:hypothetical protein